MSVMGSLSLPTCVVESFWNARATIGTPPGSCVKSIEPLMAPFVNFITTWSPSGAPCWANVM
jgi:hypothetical protein